MKLFSKIAVLGVFVMGTTASMEAAELPNILWITSEDHGPEMGCYGDLMARTPNIDALAKKGMIFNRVWSVAPVCAPARTAIITGMYPSSTGGIHMRSMVPMPNGAKMYPQYLREVGYYCTNNSKEDYNVEKSGEVWHESSGKAHWRKRQPGQPFFAVFNSTKSHESQIRTRPHQAITPPDKVRVPAYHPDTPEVRQDWAQYYDKVSQADSDAGGILQQLSDDGLFEDTIIFYYGDHGSGMPRSKRWPCNSGLHVPLVIHFPTKWLHLAPAEYQAGTRSDRLVHFVDLAPTVLSIAGIEPPSQMQGKAFAGPYQAEPHKYIFGQRGRMDECADLVRSVTDGRFVYIRNFHPHVSQAQHVDYQFQTPTTRVWREKYERGETDAAQSRFWDIPKATEELYELRFDRDEVKNLANVSEYAEDLKRLRAACHEHILAVRDVGLLPEGEMIDRSQQSSPYDMGHDPNKYPIEKILTAAEIASDYANPSVSNLLEYMDDDDAAVRYWGALGFRIRGALAIRQGQDRLKKALDDSSPYVRIVAAETLAMYGSAAEISNNLNILSELARPNQHGVFVAMAALSSLDALGKQAEPAYQAIRKMDVKGSSPDSRYDSYIPRLLANLKERFEK